MARLRDTKSPFPPKMIGMGWLARAFFLRPLTTPDNTWCRVGSSFGDSAST